MTKRFSFILTEYNRERLKKEAEDRNVSMSAIVNGIIYEWMQQLEGGKDTNLINKEDDTNEKFSKFGFNFEDRNKNIIRNMAKDKGVSMSDVINQMLNQKIEDFKELGSFKDIFALEDEIEENI